MADESLLEQLTRNRALWDSLHITNYQYSIDYEGAGWTDPPVMQIIVKDRQVQSARQNAPPLRLLECVFPVPNPEPCKRPEDPEGSKRIARTIPQLFDSLTTFVMTTQNDPNALIEFDYRYGFPIRVYFNNPGVSDGSFGYWITSFAILQ